MRRISVTNISVKTSYVKKKSVKNNSVKKTSVKKTSVKNVSAAVFLLILLAIPGLYASDNETIKSDENYRKSIDSLLSIMTLEEKIGQLHHVSSGIGFGPVVKSEKLDEQKQLIRQGRVGSFLNAPGAALTYELQKTAIEESRLKIPLLFGIDIIHGFRTTFPVPLAESCSWDSQAVAASSRFQALEAASAGQHWTFAPMVDIARDPRWGRIVEGSGEDPYLGSVMAAARVRGFQGRLSDGLVPDNTSIAACAKHFAAYGAAEGGRDYNTADISERTLREVYLPPFKAAVDAGAATLMCSFNEIAGTPSSSNKKLLSGILRDEWGFDGFVVSDWNSIGELIPHGVAADKKEAARLAIQAGVDMDMEARAYTEHLKSLVEGKIIPLELIDRSVRRILLVKYRMGLFDDPYKYCNTEYEKKTILSPEMRQSALGMAQKSIVLLKNENSLLPLKKTIKSLAVIGPLANDSENPLGPWDQMGDSSDVTTVLEGLKYKLGKQVKIMYSKGCAINDTVTSGFAEAVKIASQADAVILVLGESKDMSGEARSRSSLELPGVQTELAMAVKKTGKPIVAVLMNGRPLSINWISENIPAVMETWFLGIRAGDAIADALFGDIIPSGKTTVTFPRSSGQIPIHYNHKNSGRPNNPDDYFTSKYIDIENEPLYPFGYGLSYTTFEYGKPSLSSTGLRPGETLKVSVDVKNTGRFDAEEIVQMYIQDVTAFVTRPVKELKGFRKVLIKKGETASVGFTISENDLQFLNDELKPITEPGKFNVFIGTNSRDVQQVSFELLK